MFFRNVCTFTKFSIQQMINFIKDMDARFVALVKRSKSHNSDSLKLLELKTSRNAGNKIRDSFISAPIKRKRPAGGFLTLAN